MAGTRLRIACPLDVLLTQDYEMTVVQLQDKRFSTEDIQLNFLSVELHGISTCGYSYYLSKELSDVLAWFHRPISGGHFVTVLKRSRRLFLAQNSILGVISYHDSKYWLSWWAYNILVQKLSWQIHGLEIIIDRFQGLSMMINLTTQRLLTQ